jgi:hypothetical protein
LCTLEILRLADDRWLVAATHGGDEGVRAEPFDAMTFDLRLIWPDPPADGASRLSESQ